MDNNTTRVTCENCYFRRASLCALRLDEACPTFRHYGLGELAPPQPQRLMPRSLDQVVQPLVAQPAAA